MSETNPELADMARSLLSRLGKVALGTLGVRDGSATPFVSLVQAARAADGEVILLLSDLSDHSRHLAANPAASLLIDGTEGMAQPLAGPRLTICGSVRRSPEPDQDRATYLARFPEAALYADFGDFHFYRLAIRDGYFVAGFGRVARLAGEDLR